MRILWILAAAGLIIATFAACSSGSAAPAAIIDNGNGNANAANSIQLNITGPKDESVVRDSPVTVTGSTEPGADVMINGLSIAADDGHFSAMVELEPGPNMIDISAKSAEGKQASKYITIIYVP